MTPQELRIGNLVYNNNGYVMRVVAIDQTDVRLHNPTNDEPFDYVISEIRPIPLTEDCLEWFGFKYTEWLGSWDLEDGTFGILKTNNGKFILEFIPRCREIESVHQLQNLYFCLCGKELTAR